MRYPTTFKKYALMLLPALAFAGLAQAQNCDFSLGPDSTLCNGQSLLLLGPSGALSYDWQNGFDSQAITASATGTYWCHATFPQTGGNIVQNGDFSLGDTLFSTDYGHGVGGPYGELSNEATYAVTTNPALVHNNFADCTDHTDGSGGMLVVNGAPDSVNIWCQTVAVTPNTSYAFSAWLMSVTPDNPAEMDFLVNGISLGTPLLASSDLCDWTNFYSVWNSGSNASATICIVNQQYATSGNDFALDDIAFSALCSHTDSIEVTVLPPAPTVDAGPDGSLCPGASAAVNAAIDLTGWPYQDVSYSWSTGDIGPGITVNAPGDYTVTADGQCLHSESTVHFDPAVCATDLVMPNVFSPNGDGVNDGFGPIFSSEPLHFSMEIRNRWGQVVFTSSKASTRWNGRTDGGPVPAGTYFWTIAYGDRHNDGSTSQEKKSGAVTLLGHR